MNNNYSENKEIFNQDLINQDLTKRGYFRPKLYKVNSHKTIEYCISKHFLINILFPNISKKKQQKILKKAKGLDIWNVPNDIFEPIRITFTTCRKGCEHKFDGYNYDCYDFKIEYTREYLRLKLENISGKDKILDTNYYWINLKVLKSLADYFVILVSNSTDCFTDRTPVHLIPPIPPSKLKKKSNVIYSH